MKLDYHHPLKFDPENTTIYKSCWNNLMHGEAGAKHFLLRNINTYHCFVTEIAMLVYNNIVKSSLLSLPPLPPLSLSLEWTTFFHNSSGLKFLAPVRLDFAALFTDKNADKKTYSLPLITVTVYTRQDTQQKEKYILNYVTVPVG